MKPEIANAVYPVLAYGIRLLEDLAAGHTPEFQNAQKELVGLLKATGGPAQRYANVDPSRSIDVFSSTQPNSEFQAIKYALVAWLDEIFIADSPWKEKWTEHILELHEFKTRDRAWKFWELAERTETQQGTNSLEVYYLCVVLGFRGNHEDKPEKVKAWLESTKALIDKSAGQEWKKPVDSRPPTYVPPLTGAARLQRMVTILVLSMLLLIPAAMFFVFNYLVKRT